MSKRGLSSSSSSSPTDSESPTPKKDYKSAQKKVKVKETSVLVKHPLVQDFDMDHLLQKLESLELGQAEIKREIKNLSVSIAKIESLEDKFLQVDRISREKNVIIYGLEDSAGENWIKTTGIVEEFLQKTFNVKHGIVDVAERLGRYEKLKPRPVRVKFVRLYDKRMVIQEKKCLKHPIYINADMNLHDRKVSTALRKKKKALVEQDSSLKVTLKKGRLICSDNTGQVIQELHVNRDFELVEKTPASMDSS